MDAASIQSKHCGEVSPITYHLVHVRFLIFTDFTNVALGKQAYQSTSAYSNEGGADLAVDGNFIQYWSGKSCSHTSGEYGDYWEVDLGDNYIIEEVVVFNRIDTCCSKSRFFYFIFLLKLWNGNEY